MRPWLLSLVFASIPYGTAVAVPCNDQCVETVRACLAQCTNPTCREECEEQYDLCLQSCQD